MMPDDALHGILPFEVLARMTIRGPSSLDACVVDTYQIERDAQGVYVYGPDATRFGDGSRVRVAAWVAPVLAGASHPTATVEWDAVDPRLGGPPRAPGALLDALAACEGATATLDEHAQLARQIERDRRAGNTLRGETLWMRTNLAVLRREPFDTFPAHDYFVEAWSEYGIVVRGLAAHNGCWTELVLTLMPILYGPPRSPVRFSWRPFHPALDPRPASPRALWDALDTIHHDRCHAQRSRRRSLWCGLCRDAAGRRARAHARLDAAFEALARSWNPPCGGSTRSPRDG